MINLAAANVNVNHTTNILAGRALMSQHFVIPVPGAVLPNNPVLSYLSQNVTFVPSTAIVPNMFVIVPTSINGIHPSIPNLDAPGQFKLTAFKVTNVTGTHIVLERTNVLHDDASLATAQLEAETTYGPLTISRYYPLPVIAEGDPAVNFLVATLELHNLLAGNNNQPPQPPAIPLPPAAIPPANAYLEQLVMGAQARDALVTQRTRKHSRNFECIAALWHWLEYILHQVNSKLP